jgi:hypothetical protein
MAQRFFADHAAAAWKLAPVNPVAFHPIVNSRAADSGELDSVSNWQEMRFFIAMLAKKSGQRQNVHKVSALLKGGTGDSRKSRINPRGRIENA